MQVLTTHQQNPLDGAACTAKRFTAIQMTDMPTGNTKTGKTKGSNVIVDKFSQFWEERGEPEYRRVYGDFGGLGELDLASLSAAKQAAWSAWIAGLEMAQCWLREKAV